MRYSFNLRKLLTGLQGGKVTFLEQQLVKVRKETVKLLAISLSEMRELHSRNQHKRACFCKNPEAEI